MLKCVDKYNIYVVQLYQERRLDMNFNEYNEVINGIIEELNRKE